MTQTIAQRAAELREHIVRELEATQLEIETGNAQLTTVVDYYRQLYDARARELELLAEFNRAKVQFRNREGTLLDRLGIRYLPPD